MLGLIYKDLCVMKQEILANGFIYGLIAFIITCVPFGNIQVLQDGNMCVLIPGYLTIGVFLGLPAFYNQCIERDEKQRWSGFVISTPLGYKQQILSKYFFTLASAWLMVVVFILGEIIGKMIPGSINGFSGVATIAFYVLILYEAFDYCFAFRYGSKHGVKYRMVFLLLAFYGFMIYILFGKVPDTYAIFDYLTKLATGEAELPLYAQYMIVLLPYVSMGAFYISYRLSCRWYLKGVESYEA